MFDFNLQEILLLLPGIIIGLTVHEFCHAFAAYKLGDNTAKEMGRLTLNPIKHIDPIGFLFIVFARFGWAKPVQFNPGNLRNYRRDKALIAAAGPASNLILVLIFAGLTWLCYFLLINSMESGNIDRYFALISSPIFTNFVYVLQYAVMINLGLMIFNLLPIPPLDGSHIAFSGLNLSPQTEYRIMRLGAPLLFIIIIAQRILDITILPIVPIVSFLYSFLMPF